MEKNHKKYIFESNHRIKSWKLRRRLVIVKLHFRFEVADFVVNLLQLGLQLAGAMHCVHRGRSQAHGKTRRSLAGVGTRLGGGALARSRSLRCPQLCEAAFQLS